MSKNRILKTILMSAIAFSSLSAQDEVDAIKTARQAKAAAEKANATAAAATDAAIEAAAAKAAKDARAGAKQAKQDKIARAAAEAAAAEEAELDATAAAAAKAAKRKMAAELGIEIEDDEMMEETAEETTVTNAEETEDVVAKEALGWNVGAATSIGLLAGETFSNIPVGLTVVITTPVGFKVGPLDFTVSFGFGSYTGTQTVGETENTFNPTFIGLGGNLTLANLIFTEGHVGQVGEGTGLRGFAGVTLERLMKKGLGLPVNILVGSELFYGTEAAGENNSTGWAGFGARLDYNF